LRSNSVLKAAEGRAVALPPLFKKSQGDRQQECIKKSCGGPEHCDVLHKGCVPQESNNQNIDQENNHKHNKSLDAFSC
jgi:hypothetical protein